MNSRHHHRKRVRHFNDPGHVHELTFSCYRRMPLLTNDLWLQMLTESIDRAVDRHHYRLAAFVFMPEHMHLLVYGLAEAPGIDALLRAIKRPFSYRIKQLLIEDESPLLERLTIRQRPGVTTFRFWQEGPGYDRNLTEPGAVLAAIDYVHLNPVRRGLVSKAVEWQWSSARYFHDENATSDAGLPTIHGVPPEHLDETVRRR